MHTSDDDNDVLPSVQFTVKYIAWFAEILFENHIYKYITSLLIGKSQ